MTSLAGRKIRRYREAQSPKETRVTFGERFGVSFSTVQGWEEDGKVPKHETMAKLLATGIVTYADWFARPQCPRCQLPFQHTVDCGAADCPLAAEWSAAA